MEPMQVAVRLRPLVPSEVNTGCRPCIEKIQNQPQIVVGTNQYYTFNYVFDELDGQSSIYNSCVRPLIPKLFEGYNVTILAYGQTGTGKTYTMGTNYDGSGEMGVIPRAIIDIFEEINSSKEKYKCEVTVSFIELYNEILYDLLTLRNRNQSIVELREANNALIIPGLTKKGVLTADGALEILNEGSLLRVTGATAMNASSSRSHAVFTINIKISPVAEPKNSVLSKFHLVDLAGSERAKKTGSTGERFKEGVNINKGLLMLGNVISQLGGGNASYINYRDSKLTRLLQDSLGGNSYTLMIACISPADSNQEESICTLRYADRVRKIKNKPIVNMDPQAFLISELRKEIDSLRLQIISDGTTGSCPPSHQILEEKLMAEMRKNSELSKALKASLQHNPAIYERSLMIENVSEKNKERINELTEIVKKAVNDPATTTTFKDVLSFLEQIQLDHQQAEKDIIDLSKREQEAQGELLSQDHLEPPDDVKDEHILFQARTNREIEALMKDLFLKQDLYEQMQKNTDQLAQLNDPTSSIECLTNQVKKLEAEKEMLLSTKTKAIAANRLMNPPNTRTPENIQQRLQQLESELMKAQKKLAEKEKLLKFKANSEQKIVLLRKEIQSMKAMKVQLIHQMKAENDRFRNWQNQKNREVSKLRNLTVKQNNQISKMEKEFSLRQAVMRRKLEAAAAAKKRIEKAVDRRNISSLKKAKDFEPDKLEEYITAEIDVHESISYAKKSLQNLLDDRASLTKEISNLQSILEEGKSSLSQAELNNYKKKVEILQQELGLQSTQIGDLQQRIMDSKQDEKKKYRWDGIKSMMEAKHALGYLFVAVSKAKKDVINLTDATNDLKTELSEKFKEIEMLQGQLQASEEMGKKKCDMIVRDYEMKIYEMFSQRSRNDYLEEEEKEKDCYPLKNVTFNASTQEQTTNSHKRKISSMLATGNLSSYEREYLKFVLTHDILEGATEAVDENSPPVKRSRSHDLNITYNMNSDEPALNTSFPAPKMPHSFFD